MKDAPETSVHIVGLCGSLRKQSYNMAALRAAGELVPKNTRFTIASVEGLPVYNQDDEAAHGGPPSVRRLADEVAAADAILIATPEYNYSIPGLLKNAIDWLSRAPSKPLDRKPLGIIGASTGGFGTIRAQLHLRQVAIYTNMLALNKPEVLITHAETKVDANGRLVDEATRKIIAELLEHLVEAAGVLAQPGSSIVGLERAYVHG